MRAREKNNTNLKKYTNFTAIQASVYIIPKVTWMYNLSHKIKMCNFSVCVIFPEFERSLRGLIKIHISQISISAHLAWLQL